MGDRFIAAIRIRRLFIFIETHLRELLLADDLADPIKIAGLDTYDSPQRVMTRREETSGRLIPGTGKPLIDLLV